MSSKSHLVLIGSVLTIMGCVGSPSNTMVQSLPQPDTSDATVPRTTDGSSTDFDVSTAPSSNLMGPETPHSSGASSAQSDAIPPVEMMNADPTVLSEVCDEEDNDGDGVVDEGFDIGSNCLKSVGDCIGQGIWICDPDNIDQRTCVAPEMCNGLDDDCDGAADEGIPTVGEPCIIGTGACANDAQLGCTEEGNIICQGNEGQLPGEELCLNGIDDDCDGVVDEVNFIGLPCEREVGACTTSGELLCGDDGLPFCTADPIEVIPEQCNGIDDDCDGVVDDGQVCGPFMESQCQFYFGWTDNNRLEPGLHADVAGCPPEEVDDFGNGLCVSTRYNGLIARLNVPGDYGVDNNDAMGPMFRCRPGGQPEVAQWIQSNCRIIFGFGQGDVGARVPLETWGPCPAESGIAEGRRCVMSDANQNFHLMRLMEDGTHQPRDTFALGFDCHGEDEARSRAIEESISLTFAWSLNRDGNIDDQAAEWRICNGDEWDCIQTLGRRGIHTAKSSFRLLSEWFEDQDNFSIGIGLKAFSNEEP